MHAESIEMVESFAPGDQIVPNRCLLKLKVLPLSKKSTSCSNVKATQLETGLFSGIYS